MKLMLFQTLSIIAFGLIINSCTVTKSVEDEEGHALKILNVDSLKFIHYYTCEFKSNENLEGYILLDKSNTKLTLLDQLILDKIDVKDLCDVNQFKPNNMDLTIRGEATMGGIYEDGILVIDLSNEIEKRYYQLCKK